MYQTKNVWKKGKSLQRRRFMSSVKGVSHLSLRTKRHLYCKLKIWLWRKWRERCRLLIIRGRRRTSGIGSYFGSKFSLKPQLQRNKVLKNHKKNRESSPVGTPDPLPSHQCNVWETGLAEWSVSDRFSETLGDSSGLRVTDTDLSSVTVNHVSEAALASSQSSESSVQLEETIDLHQKVTHLPCADSTSCSEQRPQTKASSQQRSPVNPHQNQSDSKCNEDIISKAAPPGVDLNAVIRDVRDFLDVFFRRYGSFIPLCKRDVLRHLKRRFCSDFSDRKIIILSEVARYRAEILEKPIPSFRVVYKKHIVTLEDLQTLADQNWLNDQVMNMYGELIMESSHHKVHFLNSFFHRQLMTKGYDGVKRWTKQVDLFSKSLLLVPVHLAVHWCLVTADIKAKKICLYDSQGHNLQKVARNVLKYLMTEAREKKQMVFEAGWTVSYDEKIPQQTNENDCGVFVLEYSRCLALSRPFQFSQEDIPKIRKRIYKELCDCKLHERD